MRAPYRIAVAGPGGLGLCAIRESQRLPEIELVAVLAYSPHKDGMDVGTLAGIDPIGVAATVGFGFGAPRAEVEGNDFAAAPGLLRPALPQLHWKWDLRAPAPDMTGI